jgi:hypothetical protein
MEKDFNLQKFIISVILIGITLVIGIYISSALQDNMRDKNTAGTVVNESVVSPTTAGVHLASVNLRDGSCGAITAALNGTTGGNVAIELGNFTQTGCTLVNTTDLSSYTSTIRISYPYTYTADTAASNASGNVTDALSTGTSWISILVVVGFAVIILSMLTSGLSGAAERTQTPYY